MTIKRRDFLVGTAGMVGALLPPAVLSQSTPCPPPNVGLKGGSASVAACKAATSGPAPAWFKNLPDRTWTRIACGASHQGDSWQKGSRFLDVIPGHPGDHIGALPSGPGSGGINIEGPGAVFTNWTGACVDQERRELLLAANGGHSGYPGNEVYAIQLQQDVPGYVRLSDPTPRVDPNDSAKTWWRHDELTYGRGGVPGDAPGFNNDFVSPANYGRMRAVHGWNRVAFGNGRVWYAAQDSYSSATGGGHSASAWSFNRDWIDSNGEVPLRHRVSQNPWTLHGSVDWSALDGGKAPSPESYRFHPAVYDPNSKRVYTFSRAGDWQGNKVCWYVDTVTGKVVSFTARGIGLEHGGAWGACVPDALPGQSLFYFPLMADEDGQSGKIMVWNLATNQIIRITPVNASTTYWTDPVYGSDPDSAPPDSSRHPGGHGAVYHPASRSILVYSVGAQKPSANRVGLGTTLRRLRIPANPMKDAYKWEDVVAAAGSVKPAYCPNGCNSKFNIVNDMGNGQSCLVLATGVDSAYVYKMPGGTA